MHLIRQAGPETSHFGGSFAAADAVELVVTSHLAVAVPTSMNMAQKSAEIIAKTAPMTP